MAFACAFACTLLAPVVSNSAAAKPAANKSASSTGYHVRLHPDGQPPLSVYVEELGSGPVLLLLHGLGGSSYTWRQVAPLLAQNHRVVAIDLRGFGRSDKPFDQAYSPAHHAAVVRAFIKSQNLSQVTLIGHSYGGMVALMLALDRRLEPHRIARLVAIDAPAFPQAFSAGVSFLRQPVLPYVALMLVPSELTMTIAFMMEQVGFDRISNRDISMYADPLSDPGGPHALIETANQIVPPDFPALIARYPTMTKPTLIVWCRQDRVVPIASGRRLASLLPRARLAVLEGCDHMPTEQAPAALSAQILGFLGR